LYKKEDTIIEESLFGDDSIVVCGLCNQKIMFRGVFGVFTPFIIILIGAISQIFGQLLFPAFLIIIVSYFFIIWRLTYIKINPKPDLE